jgi:3-dehydroquinate synthetase
MSVLQNDKKAEGGKVRWVLLERIGKAKANVEVPEKVVREVLQGLRS